MKFKTVREGEEALILNHLGEGRVITGPARVFLFRERLTKLRYFSASQYQYLKITYNTGIVKHLRGPCSMFCNPMEHSSIVVKDAVKIDANHMIVVYQRLEDNSVQRCIVEGPQLFMPTAEEWLHSFSWHGEDENKVGHMIPNYNKFEQLRAIPEQFNYNVRDVRTNDDTMLTVELMVFYELKDIIKMLEATQDPIADMINAVCADIIAFAGKMSFEQFLKGAKMLNELNAYSQLLQRAEKIGYHISKVIYRGFQASKQLQAMQDKAIQSHTELRLNAELHEQEQKLADFRLQRKRNRLELMQKIECQKVMHQQEMEKLKNSHELALREAELKTKLQCAAHRHNMTLEHDKQHNYQQIQFLRSLQGLDTSLTDYLINCGPGKVHEEFHLIQPA